MTLSGPQKAAVIMIAIGRDRAAEILKNLPRPQVDEIIAQIANLGQISLDDTHSTLEESLTLLSSLNHIIEGGWDTARAILDQAYGSARASEMMRKLTHVSHRIHRPFNQLNDMEPRHLVQLLSGEHPQMIAIILSQLEPQVAASILGGLSPETATEVTRRLTNANKVSPAIIDRIETVLASKLDMANNQEAAGGMDTVIPILNHVETGIEKTILERLEAIDPQLAETIRGQLFTFNDIGTLDDNAIQLILRQVDPRVMALALKNASKDLLDKLGHNLSQHARAILEDEMNAMTRVRIRDVEKAQREIITLVHSLEEKGDITLRSGDRDEFIS